MTASRTRYGTKTFIVPEDEVDSSTPADYNILCKSLTSARYYGDLAVQIGHYIKKLINIDIRDSVEGVALNTLVDISYKHWVREPARVIERKISKDKHTAKIKAELINFPYQFVSRDKIIPNPVVLANVKHYINNIVDVYWTVSSETEFKQYLLEFSTSKVDYKNEYSEQGYSPIAFVTPEFKMGLCKASLSGLLPDSKYYFRVKVMDLSLNISNPSNVMSLTTANISKPPSSIEAYNCTGNLESGLSFSRGSGMLPAGYPSFGSFKFGELTFYPAGIYISEYYTCVDGFSSVFLEANNYNYFKVQYQAYGSSEWTYFSDTTFKNENIFRADIPDSPQILRFRVFFTPRLPSDVCSIKIFDINKGV